MYGLYRQANDGDVQGHKAGMLHPIARAKWLAWKNKQELSAEQAMQHYIGEVDQVEAQYG